MKKTLLSLFGMLALCAMPTWAIRMQLRVPEAEISARMLAAEQVDTTRYTVVRAACSYNPAGDAILPPSLAGRYYMIVSLYSGATKFPQMQLHMAVRDTMSITHDAVFAAIVYVEGDGVRTNGVAGDLSLEFLGYDPEAEGFATYDCAFWAALTDGRVLAGTFQGPMRFYNADRGAQDPYIPTHEEEPEGFGRTESAPAPSKMLRNGQVLIVRDGRSYDLCGRVMKL